MRVFPRPLAASPLHFRKLALGFVALCFLLHPLAVPAHADNPVSEFFSALKDGQSAGRVQAAEVGLRKSLEARQISQQNYNAAAQVSQRLVNQLESKHQGSGTFAWMENRMRNAILSDPPGHASDLQMAAALIYEEAAREVANPPRAGNSPSVTRREESATPAKPPLSREPQNQPPQAEKGSFPSQAIPILVVLIGGVSGLVWLMRRRRKPVNVSYVQVKSPVSAADSPPSEQVPATNRGTDGR